MQASPPDASDFTTIKAPKTSLESTMMNENSSQECQIPTHTGANFASPKINHLAPVRNQEQIH
jgi:hypothetical protein